MFVATRYPNQVYGLITEMHKTLQLTALIIRPKIEYVKDNCGKSHFTFRSTINKKVPAFIATLSLNFSSIQCKYFFFPVY